MFVFTLPLSASSATPMGSDLCFALHVSNSWCELIRRSSRYSTECGHTLGMWHPTPTAPGNTIVPNKSHAHFIEPLLITGTGSSGTTFVHKVLDGLGPFRMRHDARGKLAERKKWMAGSWTGAVAWPLAFDSSPFLTALGRERRRVP